MSNKLIKTNKTRMQEVNDIHNPNQYVVDVHDVDIKKVINEAEQVVIVAEDEGKPVEWNHPEYVVVGNKLLVFPAGIPDKTLKLMKKVF